MGKLNSTSLEKRRRIVESCASVSLAIIALALVLPICDPANVGILSVCKWVYAVGALAYTIARVINVNADSDSVRLCRLRRMEAWAGIAFCIGAAFWFYNSERHPEVFGFSLALIRDTIMFTLVGALIQIISGWMISSRSRKEYGQHSANDSQESKKKK